MQDSEGGGGGCPFCRAEIKGTEQIVVDPFDPKKHITVHQGSVNPGTPARPPVRDKDNDGYDDVTPPAAARPDDENPGNYDVESDGSTSRKCANVNIDAHARSSVNGAREELVCDTNSMQSEPNTCTAVVNGRLSNHGHGKEEDMHEKAANSSVTANGRPPSRRQGSKPVSVSAVPPTKGSTRIDIQAKDYENYLFHNNLNLT